MKDMTALLRKSTQSPLMIVGAPRSGNTLVRRVLMASGQIYIPPETYVMGRLIKSWPRWSVLPWTEKVWLFCAYFDRHRHRDELDVESLSPFADDAAGWPRGRRTLGDLFDGFYRFLGQEHGFPAERWGDKTPWNTMNLKQISTFFPKAQYLKLVRDGRDSVASQLRADMRDLDEAAYRWVQANKACQRFLKPENTLSMRYEDIVTNPEESFARIFAWAGLDFEERFLTEVPPRLGDVTMRDHHAAVLEPITPRSIGNWSRSLSPEQVAGLSPDFHAMMAHYNYG